MNSLENILQERRKKRLGSIQASLEKRIKVRELEIVLGTLIKEKLGYLPYYPKHHTLLLKKLAIHYTIPFLMEMMEVALEKPEVYLIVDGKENISFFSFYSNRDTIARDTHIRNLPPPILPTYTEEEEQTLTPFYRGVLEKIKRKKVI